jgi:hypothetical protein
MTNLIGTISSTSFTQPTTFGRRHHSPPYSIICVFPRGLHPNGIFSWDCQNWDFCCLKTLDVHIFFKSCFFKSMWWQNLIASNRSFQRCIARSNQRWFDPCSKGIYGRKSNSQFDLDFSFDHNSCVLSLNEQCNDTLGFYTSRPFQWYPRSLIWCLFTFLTKAPNIQDSRISATPKVGVQLRVVGLHLLHSPPFVRMCFTLEHTLLTSWAFALYI